MQVLIFMNNECKKYVQPVEFEQFKFDDGKFDYSKLFLFDEPDYNYLKIKKKKDEEDKRNKFKKLSKKQGAEADGKLERSASVLSDSDDEEDEDSEDSRVPKKPSKEEIEEEGGFWGGAKKFFAW